MWGLPKERRPLPDLSWVAEWVDNVRDYVYVRAEDQVFIQRPNKAFKLNASAIEILQRLFAGEKLADILAPHGGDPQVWQDVEVFLLDLRTMLKQGLSETYESSAVDKIPFEMAFSHLPVLSEVAVTYRCNASCLFCYAGCNCTANPVGNDREMSLDEVKQVLEKIYREAKVPSVSFTGGEATLRKDLPEMVEYAAGLGMRVNLITNGMAGTQRMVDRLVGAGLHSVQISIEGSCASLHDQITQTPGAFDKAIAALHRYREAGINVHTNTTLTRLNLDDAVTFPAFVREHLDLTAFSMNLMIPTGSGALSGDGPELTVTYQELGPVLEQIITQSDRSGVEFKWYSPTPMCLFNPVVYGLGNKGCSACDGLISVGADGQVLPCASYDQPVGDLLTHSFDEVWNSEEARRFRNKELAHDLCKRCEDFHICNGACPLYWRQMGFAELTQTRECPTTEIAGLELVQIDE